MKIKCFMTMAMACVAFVFGMSSCSSDDDKDEVAVAAQVVGSYSGSQVITIMGEPDDGTATYQFVKASDTSVDMIIPQSGSGGPMTIPPLTVKNIPLSKGNESIMGKLDSFAGTVTNASGEEKTFTVSDLAVIFGDVPSGKAVVILYTLKYGSMPFDMETAFNGSKD